MGVEFYFYNPGTHPDLKGNFEQPPAGSMNDRNVQEQSGGSFMSVPVWSDNGERYTFIATSQGKAAVLQGDHFLTSFRMFDEYVTQNMGSLNSTRGVLQLPCKKIAKVIREAGSFKEVKPQIDRMEGNTVTSAEWGSCYSVVQKANDLVEKLFWSALKAPAKYVNKANARVKHNRRAAHQVV
jgi:hypothetical protein